MERNKIITQLTKIKSPIVFSGRKITSQPSTTYPADPNLENTSLLLVIDFK